VSSFSPLNKFSVLSSRKECGVTAVELGLVKGLLSGSLKVNLCSLDNVLLDTVGLGDLHSLMVLEFGGATSRFCATELPFSKLGSGLSCFSIRCVDEMISPAAKSAADPGCIDGLSCHRTRLFWHPWVKRCSLQTLSDPAKITADEAGATDVFSDSSGFHRLFKVVSLLETWGLASVSLWLSLDWLLGWADGLFCRGLGWVTTPLIFRETHKSDLSVPVTEGAVTDGPGMEGPSGLACFNSIMAVPSFFFEWSFRDWTAFNWFPDVPGGGLIRVSGSAC